MDGLFHFRHLISWILCIFFIGVLARILADKAADVINLKISKVGGLTKARAVRDLAVSSGIPMNIEDTWGGDIVTAAIAHLAHSTPPEFLFCRYSLFVLVSSDTLFFRLLTNRSLFWPLARISTLTALSRSQKQPRSAKMGASLLQLNLDLE